MWESDRTFYFTYNSSNVHESTLPLDSASQFNRDSLSSVWTCCLLCEDGAEPRRQTTPARRLMLVALFGSYQSHAAAGSNPLHPLTDFHRTSPSMSRAAYSRRERTLPNPLSAFTNIYISSLRRSADYHCSPCVCGQCVIIVPTWWFLTGPIWVMA